MKVDSGSCFEQGADFQEIILTRRRSLGTLGASKLRMIVHPCQSESDPSRRHDEIDATGRDRAERHAGMLGRILILGEGDASLRFDGSQTLGAVRSGAREDDADGAAFEVLGQRLKEVVDRKIPDGAFEPGCEGQSPFEDGMRALGGIT